MHGRQSTRPGMRPRQCSARQCFSRPRQPLAHGQPPHDAPQRRLRFGAACFTRHSNLMPQPKQLLCHLRRVQIRRCKRRSPWPQLLLYLPVSKPSRWSQGGGRCRRSRLQSRRAERHLRPTPRTLAALRLKVAHRRPMGSTSCRMPTVGRNPLDASFTPQRQVTASTRRGRSRALLRGALCELPGSSGRRGSLLSQGRLQCSSSSSGGSHIRSTRYSSPQRCTSQHRCHPILPCRRPVTRLQ